MTDRAMTEAAMGLLRAEFPAGQVGRLPRAGTTLDYVGHGAVTARLLDVDPEWNWEPGARTESGAPALEYDKDGNPVGLWIKLTVLDVTRWGYGSCGSSQFEAEKVLIGDAIRNAAMRFGVALELWIKGHAEDDEGVAASSPPRASRGRGGPPPCVVCGEPMVGKAIPNGSGVAHEACVKPADDPSQEPF